MGFAELLMTAVSLSADAFAVAVCKGLATDKVRLRHMLICGGWFGGFQALMPLIGYLLGQAFKSYITPVDHWITFMLLAVIGFNMLRESLGDTEKADASLSVRIMLAMALATSIDALAVGITFALTDGINIVFAIGSIGAITFILSAAGVKIGQLFGSRWRAPAELVGGTVLIVIGLKILSEHIIADNKTYDFIIAASVSFILAALFAVLFILSRSNDSPKMSEVLTARLYSILASALFVAGALTVIIYFAIA